jgi:hypothetical protein
MLKLVKLQSGLVAKCCKMRKYSPAKFANFVLLNLYYARENAPLSAQMWCIFSRVIQINTKFANFAARVILSAFNFTTFHGQTLQFY